MHSDWSIVMQTARLTTLILAALGLAPGAAHVLELPVKMAYTPELYMAVTSTLYAWFGSVGAACQVGALASACWLAYRSRALPSFRPALFGAFALAASLAIWGAAVAPVNAEWAQLIKAGSDALPDAYARLRPRWEYGHVAAFAAWFAGYVLLQLSVLRPASDRVSRAM
jgi:hypothetical protein